MTSDLARRAARLADVGRFADALDLSRQALSEDPGDVMAMTVLTQSLIRLKRNSEAYGAARGLVAASPDTALPRRLLSIVHQRIGTPEQAYQAAVSATRADPFDALNHVRVAVTAREAPGRRSEALPAAEHAVHLDPGLADAHFAVGYTADDRSVKEAAYRRALAIDPAHADAANNLTALKSRGRFIPLRTLASGYLGVLGKDPTYEVSRSNLVGLAYVFVRRSYFAGLLLAYIAFIETKGTDNVFRVWPVRAVTGALGIAALLWYVMTFYRLIGPGPRAFLRRAARSEPSLIGVTVQSVGVLLGALLALFTSWVGLGLWMALCMALLSLPLGLWSRRARDRRLASFPGGGP